MKSIKLILPSLLAILAVATLSRPALRAEPLAESRTAAAANVHRVVWQLTADGPEQWEAVLGNIENVHKAMGAKNVEIEVVAHGKGLGMVLRKNADQQQRMQKLADTGVQFVACEKTMRKKQVTKADLMPFVGTVDSGVSEVIRKQAEGWLYLKAGL